MRHTDAGSVSAEFAVALPAVIVIAGALMTGVRLAADHAWLASSSSTIARSVSLGSDRDDTVSRVVGNRADVVASVDVTNDMVCVELRRRVGGAFAMIGIEAREVTCVNRPL